jgi:hypothetical protein
MATSQDDHLFRKVMDSHFEDISALIRAAKCVYLAEMTPVDQLRVLGGILDVLDKHNQEAQAEIELDDRRLMTPRQGNVVGLRHG